ncbi:MAG: TonB-dependent receptor [Phenylobacterium sp.]
MRKQCLMLTASTITAAFAMAAPAYAQRANDNAATVGEVVVTAQRREERLVDVPISITALNAETVENAGLTDIRDLQQATPGLLNVNNGLNFQPSIRGITSTATGDEGNTGLYIDDVYMPANFAGLFQLQNIERVEVLKGPQGTLYGRNSTAGAIKIVTLTPSFERSWKARLDYSWNYNQKLVSVYGTTPITSTLAADIAAVWTDGDGYVDNIAPNGIGGLAEKDYASVRSKILWKPTDFFEFVGAVSAYRSEDNSAYTLGPQGNPPHLIYRNRPGVILPDEDWEVSYSVKPKLDSKGMTASGTATVDLDGVTIKSITGYVTDKIYPASDSDRTNLAIASFRSATKTRAFSQEVNVASASDGPLNWLVGGYYFNLESRGSSHVFTGDIDPAALSSATSTNGTTTSYAGFAEVYYDVTDQITLTGGARYTQEKKNSQFADLFRPAGLRTQNAEKTWSNASYRAIVAYKPTDSSNLYLSFSTGFKSGVIGISTFPANFVAPEEIQAWEIGYKANVAGFLDIQAAAYSYKYKNIQLQSFDPSQGTLIITLSNAAEAEVQGVEFDGRARLGDNLTVTAGLSYMPKAEYSDYPFAPVNVFNPATGGYSTARRDISGSRMIRAPEFTLATGAVYTTDLAGGEFQAAVNAAYNSGFFWQSGETAEQDAYTLVNANVSWATGDGHYKFTLYGTNLSNEPYGIYQAQTAVGDSIAWGRPREFGVRLDLDF